MAQVTIYMDNSLEEKIKKLSKNTGLSISKFISQVLEKNLNDQWDSSIKNLSGSWDNFENADEIRNNQPIDIQRESF
jgi:mRNA-degrading endonuclease RelE of RelBE toxin-antitoxin system